jgi:[ribosomal protein S18]-alanine N-acetyltransferase
MATAEEAARLWPAVRSEHFDTAGQFAAYREKGPWRVRVNDRGDAAVLGVWRGHLDVIAIRGMWCPVRQVAAFVSDARAVARDLGLARILSPLLPLDLLGPYRREAMASCQRIVAIQGHARGVLPADPPLGVAFRPGLTGDMPALVALEATCFDEFWRYDLAELAEYIDGERLVVAETADGQLIGYTLATESRGAATLGRLAVAPALRRAGVAKALVSDVARWALHAGADTLSLCTQEENAAARALYRDAGFSEVRDVYGFAMGRVG